MQIGLVLFHSLDTECLVFLYLVNRLLHKVQQLLQFLLSCLHILSCQLCLMHALLHRKVAILAGFLGFDEIVFNRVKDCGRLHFHDAFGELSLLRHQLLEVILQLGYRRHLLQCPLSLCLFCDQLLNPGLVHFESLQLPLQPTAELLYSLVLVNHCTCLSILNVIKANNRKR